MKNFILCILFWVGIPWQSITQPLLQLPPVIYSCTDPLPPAPPYFRTPKFSITCKGSFTPTLLINNIFSSYQWDFGNGNTATNFSPGAQNFSKEGVYYGKLTVQNNSPFTVLKSLKIVATNSSWRGLFDQRPDYYIEMYLDGKRVSQSNFFDDVFVPQTFKFPDGTLASKPLTISIYDYDGCLDKDDFMGSVIVPAGYAGGTLHGGTDLEVFVETQKVTTATYNFEVRVENPTVSILQSCQLGNPLLQASSGFKTYAWSNGMTTSSIQVAPGTYTVTVTSTDGCTATQSITVTQPTDPKPIIDCTSNALYCANYSSFIQWYDANKKPIAGATNTQYKPTINGIYYVASTSSAKCIMSDGVSWPACQAVTTATNESTNTNTENTSMVFPNPNQGTFTLQSTLLKTKDAEIKVVNMYGVTVLREHVRKSSENKTIHLAHLPVGSYLMVVTADGRTQYDKFVIAQ